MDWNLEGSKTASNSLDLHFPIHNLEVSGSGYVFIKKQKKIVRNGKLAEDTQSFCVWREISTEGMTYLSPYETCDYIDRQLLYWAGKLAGGRQASIREGEDIGAKKF